MRIVVERNSGRPIIVVYDEISGYIVECTMIVNFLSPGPDGKVADISLGPEFTLD